MRGRGSSNRSAIGTVCLLALLSASGCNYLLFPDGAPDDAGASPDAGVEPGRDAGPPPVPDTTPPTLSVEAPLDDCLDGEVTFRIVAKDEESPIGLLTARFAGNDLALADEGDGAYSATFDASELFTGFHVLEVTAIDTANNLAELRRTFGHAGPGESLEGDTFSCGDVPDAGPPDLAPPEVEITTPPPGVEAWAATSLAVAARVTDDLGPVTVVATVGTASVALSGVTEIYSGTLDVSSVPEGERTLTVSATDGAAREGSASRPVFIDRTPPSISIVEPTAGATRVAFTDVVAEAADDNAMTRVSLFEQGIADPLGVATSPTSGDRWGVIYQLPCAGLPRDVTFEMVARDRAGNEASDAVTVTVETTGCAP